MASTDVPDPRTLESWEDAFNYPIPTVRAMERKLRGNLTENQDKLRTLVGASYRDLLSTARTIIDINGQLQQAETLLADASRKSDSRNFDRLGRNVADFESQRTARKQDRYAVVAQTATMKSCLDVVARLLRTRGSTLLAAKLLVLAFLLHTALSKRDKDADGLEQLAKRLGSLRERLNRHIDRRLGNAKASTEQLIEDLTAFSFATRSTPSDALTHFHHIRATAIQRPRADDETTSPQELAISRLELFLSTLSQSRAVFPDLISSSLKKLAARTLLTDQTILEIDALRLDIHARWFGSDIRTFTPWTRHDELQRGATEAALKSWAQRAMDVLPRTIERDLDAEGDAAVLVGIRKAVLQDWLSSRRAARGLASSDALGRLQTSFVRRLEAAAGAAAADLRDSVASSISDRVAAWNSTDDKAVPSLWDASTQSISIADGAVAFREAVVARRNGRTIDVAAVDDAFERCATAVAAVQAAVQEMRDTRWDDDYDDDEDYDSADEEDDSIATALSRRDPDRVHAHLKSGTLAALSALQKQLESADALTRLSVTGATSPGVFALRALRCIRSRIPALLASLGPADPVPATPVFCGSLASGLHDALAKHVAAESSTSLSKTLDRVIKKPLAVRALWDGRPPTPVQPSPWAFAYLRALVRVAAAVGADLWTGEAVAPLKARVARRVGGELGRVVRVLASSDDVEVEAGQDGEGEKPEDVKRDDSENAPQDDDAKDDNDQANDTAKSEPAAPTTTSDATSLRQTKKDTRESKQDKALQLLFDGLYLSHALAVPVPSVSSAQTPRPDSDDDEEPDLALKLEEAIAALRRVSRGITADADADAKTDVGKDGGVAAAIETRIERAAGEYWRRTYLLFGVLAPGGRP